MGLAYVFVECPACNWRSQTWSANGSGRMMGVCGAGNSAEDEFDAHYTAEHYEPFKREGGRHTSRNATQDSNAST